MKELPTAQKALLIGAWAVLAIALTIQFHTSGITDNWSTVLFAHCIFTLALCWGNFQPRQAV